MAKGQKSSATSATRKKHARKAAGEQALPLPKEKKPKDKTKGKGKGKEPPRPKVYIPPTRPTRARPDPLDAPGISAKLPPDLLVLLRRLGKKDAVTKRKALEDFQAEWVGRAMRASTDDGMAVEDALVDALPVWVRIAAIGSQNI